MQANDMFLPFLNEIPKNEYFEIAGLKLFLDDIILICLIIFLYNENVKDQFLLIILVLLLLS